MEKVLISAEEAATLIRTGRFLALAGAEPLLRRLPAGNWIGGTIPYFIGEEGGTFSSERVHVTELAGPDSNAEVRSYTRASLPGIAKDAPENGFTLLIIPALSALHQEYADHAADYEEMFMKPIVGWISGVDLGEIGKVSPKVVNGRTGQVSDDVAVAIHVPLPAGKLAMIRTLNLFRQGDGDVLTFPESGFSASDCLVNGQPANFARYVQEQGMDLSRPLVADYSGAQINTSFQSVDAAQGKVQFYAPVFAGVEYRHAAPVGDYVQDFSGLVAGVEVRPVFACNCILNYLHGKLEGRKTGRFTGPITFGEIGYQLLNQTLVYLETVDAP